MGAAKVAPVLKREKMIQIGFYFDEEMENQIEHFKCDGIPPLTVGNVIKLSVKNNDTFVWSVEPLEKMEYIIGGIQYDFQKEYQPASGVSEVIFVSIYIKPFN